MSSEPLSRLEQVATRVMQETVAQLEEEFSARNLVLQVLPLRSSGSGDSYESEIGVYIWSSGKLVDALEYLLYRGGRARMTEMDVTTAIKNDLKSALQSSP